MHTTWYVYCGTVRLGTSGSQDVVVSAGHHRVSTLKRGVHSGDEIGVHGDDAEDSGVICTRVYAEVIIRSGYATLGPTSGGLTKI